MTFSWGIAHRVNPALTLIGQDDSQSRAGSMRSYLTLLSSSSAVRDYAVAGIVLTVLSLVGFHSLSAFIESTQQSVRVQTAKIEKKDEATRQYTVTRSVLDDQVATGSIAGGKGRPIILDPCTGQIKSK